jgi:excisionase family DNA binding protein
MSTEKQHGPEWFSIKKAAQYLSIGEPTLYRWMRDGKITYRKVGDSTRFLREDLNTFIQIFPSKREAEKVKQTCPVCHHNDLVTGVFRSTGLNYFRPKKSKFWSMRDSNVKTMALMCQKCGAVTHFGDSAKLEKLVARAKAAEDAFKAEKTAPVKPPQKAKRKK